MLRLLIEVAILLQKCLTSSCMCVNWIREDFCPFVTNNDKGKNRYWSGLFCDYKSQTC